MPKRWANDYEFPNLKVSGDVVNRKWKSPSGNIAGGQSFIFNLRRPQNSQDPRVYAKRSA